MSARGIETRSIVALAALLRGIGEFASSLGSGALGPEFPHIADRLREPLARAWTLTDRRQRLDDRLGRLLDEAWQTAAGGTPSQDRATAMFAPLSAVRLDAKPEPKALLLAKLNFDEATLIPREAAIASPAILFREFVHCADLIAAADLDIFIQTLLAALETYAWCVPADADGSVSIFERSRAAAAIAGTLANEADAADRQAELMLAVGDLGGIQRFLYTVVASKAARMLRGRSLALQLMADAIAHRILDCFELPVTSLLYSGGGKLWLLMPPAAQNDLRGLAEKIDLELSHAHGGRLSFAVGCATAPLTQFAVAVPAIWKQATADLGKSRLARFSRTLGRSDGYDCIFNASDYVDRTCKVCGSPSADLKPLSAEDDDRQRDACNHCRDFVQLGGSSTRAEAILRAPDGTTVPSGSLAEFAPFVQGQRYHLYAETGTLHGAPPATTLLWLHQTPAFWDGRGAHAIWPAGLNRALGENGEPLDFDELAKNSDGIRRLGILRMDVDNLGTIFQKGLGEHQTIAHLATLSRHLTYFFGGYLSTLLKSADYEHHAQIVYSGGDDLFIVGAWSTIPYLALDIRGKLRQFAGEKNSAVTISGGIELTLPRLPVTVAAEQAAEAEDEAKHLRPKKNAITFLGEPLGWEEFDVVVDLKRRLADLFLTDTSASLARVTLRNLLAIAVEARNAHDVIRKSRNGGSADDLKWAVKRGKWAWQAAYAFARGPKNAELQRIYAELQNAIGPSIERPVLALLKPATEWIDLLGREQRDER
jgi:CRISPR-associated protein Csm1